MNDDEIAEIVSECNRQFESCLYTSTTLYIWLREQEIRLRQFTVAQISLGGIATCSIIAESTAPWAKWVGGICALLAGLLPLILGALRLDTRIEEIRRCAVEYTNLRDRFRQTEKIGSLGNPLEFKAEFERAMQRMDEVRRSGLTPPERCFESAREKIAQGHYAFDSDSR